MPSWLPRLRRIVKRIIPKSRCDPVLPLVQKTGSIIAIAGFASSYGVRGLTSGDWHFTAMDAANLVIAIWAACLQTPAPGVSVPVDQQHVAAQEATDGINEAIGGTNADALIEVEIQSWIGEPSDGVVLTHTTVDVTQWTRDADGTWMSKVIAHIEEYGHIALDGAGTLDPTPFCDTVNTIWYLVEGDLSNAGMSAVSTLPYLGDIIGKGGKAGLAVAHAWKLGDPITNLTRSGKTPVWSTIRRRFWKNEALNNASEYAGENLARMQKGLAPQYPNATGVLESMELHHNPPLRDGGLYEFQKVTPSDHAMIDPHRHIKQ